MAERANRAASFASQWFGPQLSAVDSRLFRPLNFQPSTLNFPPLKTKSSSAWSAAKSEDHYGFKRWGSGHISVDDEGFVNVQPLVDGRGIRVLDVVQEALGMGLKAPMVIRFQDLLRHRVVQVNEMFAEA